MFWMVYIIQAIDKISCYSDEDIFAMTKLSQKSWNASRVK